MYAWWLWSAAALAVWTAWLWNRLPDYRLSWRLPGARWAAPLLGHSVFFLGYPQEGIFGRMRTALLTELTLLPYAKMWLGPQLVTLVTDADCVERVIFKRSLLHKGDLLHAADKIVGNGMLFGSGAEVKRRRRGILPSFRMRILEEYVPVFHRHCRLLREVLDQNVTEGEDFHLEKYLHCCSFDAVNETCIEVQTNCLRGEHRALLQCLIDVYGLLYEEMLKPWLYHARNLVRRFGFKFRSDRIAGMLNEHIGRALQRKRAQLQSGYMNNIIDPKINSSDSKKQNRGQGALQNGGGSVKVKDDFDEEWTEKEGAMSTLEFMLRSDFQISDDDLIMELKNIFMASSDTVAQICSFLFKMFAVHTECQERAYAEAVSVLGEGLDPPTPAQLARLEYLDWCIKEALRLFPIAPLIPRKCEEPLTLDDKVTLPPGATILVGAFWLHRSTKHWSNPHAFNPEHFSPAQQATRHRTAFIPFSGGPHSCIGQQYAMIFMKVIAATVLLEFRVEPSESDYVICADHATKNGGVSHANQNGDHQKKHRNINGVNRAIKDNLKIVKSEFINDKIVNSSCKRNGCTGRYIPEDYVDKMNLSSDISVRLIAGIDVKMYRRNKNKYFCYTLLYSYICIILKY